MRTTLSRIALAIAVIAATLGVGAAFTSNVEATSASSYVKLYENTYREGDNSGTRFKGASYVWNLGQWSDGLNPTCSRPVYQLSNWDDCASSAYVNLVYGDCVRLMTDPGGRGTVIFQRDARSRTTTFGFEGFGTGNDKASSVQFGNWSYQNQACVWLW